MIRIDVLQANRNFLFLCGVGRSGTTALSEALNLDPHIVLGIERYKYRFIGAAPPEEPRQLFEKHRFFSYDPEDTNIRIDSREYGPVYESALEKFDTATYVGDKIPGLYKRLPFLHKKFPECKVIYILRRPLMVANSWQARANNNRDNWPKKNGYRAAIAEWNRSLEIIANAKEKWGRRLIVVEYERSFGPHAKVEFSKLLKYLDLPQDFSSRMDEFLSLSEQKAGTERDVSQEIQDHVSENANFDLYRSILQHVI
ncbi:conserved hypothetical protein [Ruegeria sp. TrichCH4B]|nr:conserved hypothetical protein [Ruegeria sp. TrichCH4B]